MAVIFSPCSSQSHGCGVNTGRLHPHPVCDWCEDGGGGRVGGVSVVRVVGMSVVRVGGVSVVRVVGMSVVRVGGVSVVRVKGEIGTENTRR